MKNKRGFAPVLIAIVIIIMIVFGFVNTGTLFGSNPPHYIYSTADSSCSCISTSKFFGEVGSGYKTKTNVVWVNTYDEEKNIENDDNFIWDIGLRCSSETQGSINKDGIIPAQQRCDGTFDCNFGYTSDEWVLDGVRCYVKPKPITVYRLQSNNCRSFTILPSEKIKSDYDSIESCYKDLQDDKEGGEQTTETYPQPSELNFIERFIQWIKNIFK